jgi:hypothetical protein
MTLDAVAVEDADFYREMQENRILIQMRPSPFSKGNVGGV